MADIALVTANRISVVESFNQVDGVAAEAITAGMGVRLDATTGHFRKTKGDTAGEAGFFGIASRTVAANEALMVVRLGVMDGYDLSDLNYGDPVYLSDTDGRLADGAEATVDVIVGRVIPGTSQTLGVAFDKLLAVEHVAAVAGAS